eukprot:154874_1
MAVSNLTSLCFLLAVWFSFHDAAKLSFKPSSSNTGDEYCTHALNDNPVSSYCGDIDELLIDYCGDDNVNDTLLTLIDPSYDPLLDLTDDECIFYLQHQQTISKTYMLSDDIQIEKITFTSDEDATITLSQSFVSIASYHGLISIQNIDFISNGNTFSFIDLLSDDAPLNITIHFCQLSNMNAVHGSIIKIPNHSPITPQISIAFEDCLLMDNTAQYGGILYIERNNVYVTLENVEIDHSIATKGGVIHWICQEKKSAIDLCGDLYATHTTITNIDADIFHIDLSLDPSEIQFILDVDTSTFTNINGTIFNLNHNNELLSPTGRRIQEQNTFISIMHSTFRDNGHKTGTITQWNRKLGNYLQWPGSLTTNGTIFKINAESVPNITIDNTTFINNAALHGTIVYWYCSRAMRWVKDNYCGSIALTNSVFDGNFVPTTDYFARYGSLIYGQIHPFMEFNLMIDNCTFTHHLGNMIYLEQTTLPIPQYIEYANSSSNSSIIGNVSDYAVAISMVYIEHSQFMNCTDYQNHHPHEVGTVLTIKGLEMVFHYIAYSSFEENEGKIGSSVLLADYAPILNITHSEFKHNGAPSRGILHVEQEPDGVIQITDTVFRENGFYSWGNHYGKVSVLSTGQDTVVSLDLIRSQFIYNQHSQYGAFGLHSADVNIVDCIFDSNQGLGYSAILFSWADEGQLNITDTVFDSNAEQSHHFSPSPGIPRGMFNAYNVSITTDNVQFIDNRVLGDGIFVTHQLIALTNNTYTRNDIPRIVDGAANSVRVEDCVFVDNEISEYMVQASDISVIYSQFTHNHGAPLFGHDDGETFSLTLSHSNFTNGSDADYGGIVFINGSNVQIDVHHCVFEKNEVSRSGGVMYVNGAGNVMISECDVIMNTAGAGGGFLFAKGVSLGMIYVNTVNNIAYAIGGFLYLENTTAKMTNVTFHKNGALLSAGAIAANGDNVIEMEQCHFDGNFASLGGAMYVLQSDIQCNGCYGTNDYADTAGFLYMDQGSNVYMNHAELTNHHSKFKGGAIFITAASDTAGSYFECNHCNVSNTTSPNGAILYSEPGNVVVLIDNNVCDVVSTSSSIVLYQNEATLTGCVFQNNEAGPAGGVIQIASDSFVNITECVFSNNSAEYYGGAIYVGDKNELNVLNSRFEGNMAAIGGAIAVQTGGGTHERHNAVHIEIEGTCFEHNIAYQSGGALYVKREAASVEIADTFYHYIGLKQGNQWNDNRAIFGGAIAMDFRSKTPTGVAIEVCDRDLIGNQWMRVTENTFVNNSADNEGGVLYLRCMQLHVESSQFESNYATGGGGGVAYLSETKTFIDDSTFSSAQHTVEHAAQLFHMTAINDADFEMQNSNISQYTANNTADDTAKYSLIVIGGAMAPMTFSNVLFRDNALPLMYSQSFDCAHISFFECQFICNDGWTVIDMDHTTYRQPQAHTVFDGVLFADNTVTFGLVRLGTSHTHFYNSTIRNNSNTLLISTFILVSDLSMKDSFVTSNRGKYDGVISITEGAHASIRGTRMMNNEVGGVGGAIQSRAKVLDIFGCEFWDNTAGLNGGHIAQYENTLIIDNCVFDGGRAMGGNGGAIWMSRYNVISGMIARVSNTLFGNNSARFHGGAILQYTASRNRRNSLSLRNVEFASNVANHSGSALYIVNKYDIDIVEENVRYVANRAHVIDGDKESWPFRYSLHSNQSRICPGCNVSIEVNAFNLFGAAWTPHKFTEALFFVHGQEDNMMNISSSSSMTIADFARNVERDFEIKRRMISSGNGVVASSAQIRSVYQSSDFIHGVGREVFSYGPAVLDDELTFIVTGFLKDGFIRVDSVNISFGVDLCLPHMGATVFDEDMFLCTECVQNRYRFVRTASEGCAPCPQRAVCDGGSAVYVENDHYPLISDSLEHGFEVLECVPGTCCLQSLCLWSEVDSLCPDGRNATSPMCSTCKDSYSVSPLSTECIECEGINIWYFVVPAICYGALIWWWGHKSPFSSDLAAWEIYTFKTLSFYYQILPSINLLIPDESETTDISATIEGIFNFNPQIKNVCAYENLTNLQQLLLSFVTPAMCLLWIALFWMLDRISVCAFLRRQTQRTLRSNKLSTALCSFFFFKAAVKFFIQVYAQLTRTSFSLLSCRPFGDGTAHMYYSADIECYEWWHMFAFLGVAIACILPMAALYLLLRAKRNLRVSAWWHILTLGYTRRVWWYDVFRMASRLFVILLVSVPVLEAYRLVLTRWLTYMYLVIHIWLLPFDRRKYLPEIGFDINHAETFSLGLLCLLVHLADYEQDDVLQVYNALKLAPAVMLPLLLCYQYAILKLAYFKHLLPDEIKPHLDRTNAAFKSIDVDPTALHVPANDDQIMTMIDDDDDEYEEELQQLSNIRVFKQTFRNKLEVGIKMLSLDKSKTKSKSVDGKLYASFDEGDQVSPPAAIATTTTANDHIEMENPYVEMETPIPNDTQNPNFDIELQTIHDLPRCNSTQL